MKKALILIAVLALVAAACSESTGTTPATTTTTEVSHDADDGDPDAVASTTTPAEVPHEDDSHDDGDTHAKEPMADMEMVAMMAGDSFPEAFEGVTSQYEVVLVEFSFSGDSLDLTPGETVRFVLTNTGAVEHEFRLTTEHAAAEHLEGGHSDHGDSNDDIIVMVPAGQMRDVEMTLPIDTVFDLVACLIPGHYEAGMFGPVE